jgi:glycosyltransferase involved in cell wall biosynthesis
MAWARQTLIEETSLLGQPARLAEERPLRIALFTERFLPKIDGITTRLLHTIRHLRESGQSVLVIAPEGVTDFEGTPVHAVPGFKFPLYPDQILSIPRPSVGRVLSEFGPDLIHTVNPACLGISAFFYSVSYQVPLVVSYHTQLAKYLRYYGLGRLEPLMWWGIRNGYNRADLTLATSRAMQIELEKRGIRRVDLWRRGVDTETFHPRRASLDLRARLTEGHPEEKLLLYVGRLSAEKEIESCRLVLSQLPGSRLALVGDGPHRAKLEEYFAGTPTYFAGFLRGAELAAAFASADVFFMPSRTETLGLVLLEAMASGCPVVAAAAGGILDVVQDGVTGHLYDPARPADAIPPIRRLLEDRSYRERMSRQVRLDAEQWSWAEATRQLERYYRQVIRRERELPRQIAERTSLGATEDDLCKTLQISRATLRRHRRNRPGATARLGRPAASIDFQDSQSRPSK